MKRRIGQIANFQVAKAKKILRFLLSTGFIAAKLNRHLTLDFGLWALDFNLRACQKC
jgi:hypothetical protein